MLSNTCYEEMNVKYRQLMAKDVALRLRLRKLNKSNGSGYLPVLQGCGKATYLASQREYHGPCRFAPVHEN